MWPNPTERAECLRLLALGLLAAGECATRAEANQRAAELLAEYLESLASLESRKDGDHCIANVN